MTTHVIQHLGRVLTTGGTGKCTLFSKGKLKFFKDKVVSRERGTLWSSPTPVKVKHETSMVHPWI